MDSQFLSELAGNPMRDGGGESEQIAGKALKGDYAVLATNLRFPVSDDPNHQGNSRRWTMSEVEHSLRRLQTDHIDFYQLHRPDSHTDIEETVSALSDLVHNGKVSAIGSSTMPAPTAEAPRVAERRACQIGCASDVAWI